MLVPHAEVLARSPANVTVRNFPAIARSHTRNLQCPPADSEWRGQTLRHGRTSSLDLNRDIKIPCMVRQCWHAGERDFGVRAQPAEHVRVRRSCAEVWFHQQIAAYAPDRRLLTF